MLHIRRHQAYPKSIARYVGYAGCQQSDKLLGTQRAAKKVALPFFAILRLEESQLHRFLHPFGNHLLLEAITHGDDGANDDAIV